MTNFTLTKFFRRDLLLHSGQILFLLTPATLLAKNLLKKTPMSSTYYNKLISVVLDPTKKQDDNPFTLNTKKYSLVLFDVTNSKIIKQSPINLFPHDIIRLNRSSDKVLMIEKWGSKICSYDITKNRTMKFRDITEEKHSGPKYVPSLMGHGQVAGTDKFIYTTEIIVDDRNLNSSLDFKLFGNGFVSVRNTDSLQTVKRISTFGKIPHDCILLDDQKTLAVLNSGTEYMVERKIVNYDPKLNLSSLVFIDLESGKLIKKILLKNTPHIRPVHMKRTKDGDFIIIGKPNLSRRKTYRRKDQSVLVLKDQKTFYPIAIPLELRGRLTHEMLSMELDKHRSIVGVTSPDDNIVTFWDYELKKFIKNLNINHPRSIRATKDNKYYVVNGQDGLVYISTNDLKIKHLIYKKEVEFKNAHSVIL